MNGICNFLKEAEEKRLATPHDKSAHKGDGQIPERRRSGRLWVYLPVLVYGRTIESEPFHEGTEALRVKMCIRDSGFGAANLEDAGFLDRTDNGDLSLIHI